MSSRSPALVTLVTFLVALPVRAHGDPPSAAAAVVTPPVTVLPRTGPLAAPGMKARLSGLARYESTVRGGIPREEIARVSLSGEEVQRIAGARGDLLGAALNLPSVARSPFDAGQLILRGAAPGESGAFLNGIAIPQAFHFGVGTSTFNSYLLDHFELIPSNMSARFGRLAGGVVDVVPRVGRSDRIHGDVKVDILEAHLIVEGPIGKGSFALALRRSYIDAFLGAVVPPGTVTLAPRYYDYQALLDQSVAGGHLQLLLYGSDDALGLAGGGSSLLGAPNQRFWFHTLNARYTKKWARDELDATISTGPRHAETSGGAAGTFVQDQVALDARIELRHRIFATLRGTVGFDLQSRFQWLRIDGAPVVATEDQVQIPSPSIGPLQPTRSLRSEGLLVSPAVYVQADWQPTRRLTLTLGARADWFANKRRTFAQPRLMARLEVARATFVKLGAGLYYQPPDAPLDDAVLGNPTLRPQQAIHLMLGVESRPFSRQPSLSVEANLFYKDLRNLVVASGETALVDGEPRPLHYSDEGIGRVYGGDVYIRQDSPRWLYGWLSYTLLRSERQDHPSAGDPWRPFRFDQTHILTLVVGYHLPWQVDVGARLRYATGNPDTDLSTGGYTVFDVNRGVYLPRPAALFSSRLPDFVQLDVRIDKRFVFRSWMLSVYLDAYNATNQSNAEGYTYSFDYSRRKVAAGLPIIPSFGLRATF